MAKKDMDQRVRWRMAETMNSLYQAMRSELEYYEDEFTLAEKRIMFTIMMAAKKLTRMLGRP